MVQASPIDSGSYSPSQWERMSSGAEPGTERLLSLLPPKLLSRFRGSDDTLLDVLTLRSETTWDFFNEHQALLLENAGLRKSLQQLQDQVGEIRAIIGEIRETLPETKVVVLREITREQAKTEIKELFGTGETLYMSDIAERLGLDLELVVEICRELIAAEEIGEAADG